VVNVTTLGMMLKRGNKIVNVRRAQFNEFIYLERVLVLLHEEAQ
jgi:hypothetical protein